MTQAAYKRKTAPALPAGVTEADLKYPALGRARGPVESYYCALVKQRDGDQQWMVRTLHIGGRRDEYTQKYGARSYAMGLDDGKVYRIGRGPHVVREVTVWVASHNRDRLAALVKRAQEGGEAAGIIRDRISTRRARGQLMRAQGRTYWQW